MTQDEINRMAREAGGLGYVHDAGDDPHKWQFTVTELQAFIVFVRADERNKVAQWMMAQGYATGHGDTTEDLLEELDWQITESWSKVVVASVEAEREACAKVCEDKNTLLAWPTYAAAIRARGQA
jgi:hypothetical protein